tara:strand:+ start:127 stop:534 length:408 start_codon:yes stop_codon:yes gene_type:complete
MNEDIPTHSFVLLKIIAVVQVMIGLGITSIGSYFMAGIPNFNLGISIIIFLGLFIVYAGVQSLRARLSVFNWILSCVLLIMYMAFYMYSNSFTPLTVIFGSSVALLGMVGLTLSENYKKYQLRKSLKTLSKTKPS